jgi:hypothetical protein
MDLYSAKGPSALIRSNGDRLSRLTPAHALHHASAVAHWACFPGFAGGARHRHGPLIGPENGHFVMP